MAYPRESDKRGLALFFEEETGWPWGAGSGGEGRTSRISATQTTCGEGFPTVWHK
jgi:hypothetical protein